MYLKSMGVYALSIGFAVNFTFYKGVQFVLITTEGSGQTLSSELSSS